MSFVYYGFCNIKYCEVQEYFIFSPVFSSPAWPSRFAWLIYKVKKDTFYKFINSHRHNGIIVSISPMLISKSYSLAILRPKIRKLVVRYDG